MKLKLLMRYSEFQPSTIRGHCCTKRFGFVWAFSADGASVQILNYMHVWFSLEGINNDFLTKLFLLENGLDLISQGG